MSNLELRKSQRTIEELRGFLKKIFVEPDIISHSLAITRELIDEDNADAIIAQKIAATTNVKIPAEHSDADQLFLQVLREVVRDENAMY
ncbi:hypothetical protein OAD42_05145 [Oceanospirillaceae bacterium]|jgi:hypothetical protein|uniref:hypothetical protein n=1 Tax=Candidatus Njordibacter sp. Uisw_002 TaxID=3230971 RepID=UPI00233E4B0B|nr:hypothetical protein [Oceanospirillaceae bacterium]MDB9753655.1 hypothetical protein [Oceanospirillaceae bacterium]MDB9869430.1 hypothetical protein [Oceanospirillaceae bacterium]MDB9958451.1 hypothetical protein [Oceanospirillaceae bacterium]MDC1341077.1 hypothetical protein [Oceanospirillaceae bacterium]|tara:strand:- start:4768 stop:5034 length:267 start_codon:yes stop_codon:yes gene_type:complete